MKDKRYLPRAHALTLIEEWVASAERVKPFETRDTDHHCYGYPGSSAGLMQAARDLAHELDLWEDVPKALCVWALSQEAATSRSLNQYRREQLAKAVTSNGDGAHVEEVAHESV
jgi:hypothetical protein